MRVVLVPRVSVAVGLLLAVSPVGPIEVHAASNICDSLKKQLVAVSSGRGVKSSRNVQQQSLQLQQMRAKASKEGCGGFLLSRGDPSLCRRYAQSIATMSARLARLKAASDRTGGPSRQQVLASMSANGCSDSVSARNDPPSNIRRKSLFEVLFGGENASPLSRARHSADERLVQRNSRLSAPDTLATSYEGTDPDGNVIVKKGSYRTLCVRTCDGYYFPISFSSQPRHFARDQNACTAMCPNGNAQLYFHAVPEQESDDMISVADKKPYRELPNAFDYRIAGLRAVPGCSCHARPASQPELLVSDPQLSDKPVLAGEGTDPGVVAAVPAREPAQRDAGDLAEARNVRIVGPAFFPVETKVTDFKALPPGTDAQRASAGMLTPENIVRMITSDILRRIE
ncbi:DUF2865 domain-containing protein [Phyllobacterium lublinensis]|uniref:DUF2865 domain-containing protein n=1 Tax=Phyllobacterium lublinensis TaxID=2875708 RepID=UPI001CCFE818|nr:DUF2865 domain-containing protein [Phyllobacterium sp. 2063]MBZ9657192.1 DUF2865 domain-containing protein [Phyllobacterium sp. 2063]